MSTLSFIAALALAPGVSALALADDPPADEWVDEDDEVYADEDDELDDDELEAEDHDAPSDEDDDERIEDAPPT